MGENYVLIRSYKNKKLLISLFIYVIVWIIPIFILTKDFYQINNIINLLDSQLLRILIFTLLQAFVSSVLSLLISIFPAIYISKKNNLLSKVLESTIFIPFFFPPISTVIAFSLIYSSNGLFNNLFNVNLNIMHTIYAIFIAHVFYNSPIFVKYIGEALKSIPEIFNETAELEGANKWTILLKIEIPLILPAVSRAFFLVFTYCFTSFAIVLSLGGLRFSTLEVAISQTLRSSFDFSKAINYAIVQFLVLLIINAILSKVVSYEFDYERTYNKKSSFTELIFSIFYFCFEFIIVIGGIFAAFYNFYDMKIDFSGLFNLFSESLNNRFPVIRAYMNTFFVSLVASIITTFFTYFILRNFKKYMNILILSVIGVSSAFLAISLLYLNILYDIPYVVLVIIGYILITVPIAYSFMFHHIRSFDKSILEAARVDGANNLNVISKIEFPILFPIIIATILQIFAIIFGEFTISYTMQLRDVFPLISIVNYSLSSNRFFRESSALGGLNILIIFFIFLISKIIEKKYYKN